VFFVPLVSVLLGSLFLGESLSSLLLVGAALVVSGIYLVNRQGSQTRCGGEKVGVNR
jgi:O-acetylserine/cysteine efflux transporter